MADLDEKYRSNSNDITAVETNAEEEEESAT
jgi:hypothetical protein